MSDQLEMVFVLSGLNHRVVDNAKVPALPSSPPAATPSIGAANVRLLERRQGPWRWQSVPSVSVNSPEN